MKNSYVTEQELVANVKAAIKKSKLSAARWGMKYNTESNRMYQFLNGRTRMPPTLLKALKLKRITVYTRNA